MKKQKEPKVSAKVKVDIKALKKLLKKIDLKSSVVSVIGLVILIGVISSTRNYFSIDSGEAQIPPLLNEEPLGNNTTSSPYSYLLCDIIIPSCDADPGEYPITCGNYGQTNPAIYGDIIVWVDDRDSNGGLISFIYIQDLSDPTYPRYGKKLISNSHGFGQNVPDIYQHLIVWEDWRTSPYTSNIYMWDLDTQQETPITTAPNLQVNPKIWGNFVVWEDYRNSADPRYPTSSDIYAADLTTTPPTEIQITNTSASEIMPDIWNNLIVFRTRGLKQITVYDLVLKQTVINIMPYNQLASPPKINANKIVWVEKKNLEVPPKIKYRYTIYVLDLFSGDIQPIDIGIDDQANQYKVRKYNIDIQDNQIVWDWMQQNNPSPEFGSYIYNLDTHIKTKITTDNRSQYPAVYGNRIVWTDYRNSWYSWPPCPTNSDIYMREIN